MSKKENKVTGNRGEDLAQFFLEDLGFKILERNFTSNMGEIDIIAKDGDTLVFVEVKSRTQGLFGAPCESVNEPKQNQIYNVAKYYLYIKKLIDPKLRFDVVEVFMLGDYDYRVNYIQDVIFDDPNKRRRRYARY